MDDTTKSEQGLHYTTFFGHFSIPNKEVTMSEKLEITKEAVLKAAERCPTAKEVLKDLFPDVFISNKEIKAGNIYYEDGHYFLVLSHWRDGLWQLVDLLNGFMYSDSCEQIERNINSGERKLIGHLSDLASGIQQLKEKSRL